jgi:hypothetical protein
MVALTASQVVEDLVRAAGRWRLSPACPGRRPSPRCLDDRASRSIDSADQTIYSRRIGVALERWRHLSRLSQQRLDADHSDFTTSEAPLIRGEPEQDLHAFSPPPGR